MESVVESSNLPPASIQSMRDFTLRDTVLKVVQLPSNPKRRDAQWTAENVMDLRGVQLWRQDVNESSTRDTHVRSVWIGGVVQRVLVHGVDDASDAELGIVGVVVREFVLVRAAVRGGHEVGDELFTRVIIHLGG
eukprot:scaffold229870_cov14-Prasinocladus_malaysianus.AAC.1